MTISDQINAAWTKKQLRQSPPKYIALLEGLKGQHLTTDEKWMCEELYLLNMVARFTLNRWIYNASDPLKSSYYNETRYLNATDPLHQPCTECEILRARIHDLEELLTSKTVFSKVAV